MLDKRQLQYNFDLKLIINRYKDRIPNDLIPIAECPGGDQLCIGIKNKAFGKIYYWDHNKEKIQVNTIEEMWEPVTLIYNTFFDLITSSQELKENKNFDDSTIENIKVSEKFLSRKIIIDVLDFLELRLAFRGHFFINILNRTIMRCSLNTLPHNTHPNPVFRR